MQISPILETIVGLFEYDRSPIIFELPLYLISNTGTVLILIPKLKSR